MTRTGFLVRAWLLALLGLPACRPAAIPLHGDLPDDQAATLRETENLGGKVEITRVDQSPVPEGTAYAVATGKHQVELVRQSPTSASSNETYFVAGGGEYVTWDGCVRETDPKTGEEKEKLNCELPPQLLPEAALHCYQHDERTSPDCKELTDAWSESGGEE